MRKISSVLSCGALLCSLAASAPTIAGAAGSRHAATAAPAAAPRPEPGAHLVMWLDPQYKTAFEAVIKDFEAKYHVPVTFEPLLAAGQQSAKLAVAGPA